MFLIHIIRLTVTILGFLLLMAIATIFADGLKSHGFDPNKSVFSLVVFIIVILIFGLFLTNFICNFRMLCGL